MLVSARFPLLLAAMCGAVGGCAENKYFVSASMFPDGGPTDDSDGLSESGPSDASGGDGGSEDDTDTGDTGDTGESGGTEDSGTGGSDDGGDSHHLQQWDHVAFDSDIWSGLAEDAGEVHMVSLLGGRVVLYDLSDTMEPTGSPVLLMSNEPFPGFDVTDIAVARIDDWVYVTASNPAATELVIAAYAVDGAQVLAPRRVVEGSRTPTNDMKLVERDGQIQLFYGGDGFDKQVLTFDEHLSPMSSPGAIDDPSGGSQMGCVVPTAEGYVRIEGNRSNHGLTRIEYDADWNTDESKVFSVDIPAGDDEWVWFSSGCVQDPVTGEWYVGYQHMWDGETADTMSSVYVARFAPDWSFRETVRVSEARGFTRPQLAIHDDRLVLSYDMRFDVRGAVTYLDPDR